MDNRLKVFKFLMPALYEEIIIPLKSTEELVCVEYFKEAF